MNDLPPPYAFFRDIVIFGKLTFGILAIWNVALWDIGFRKLTFEFRGNGFGILVYVRDLTWDSGTALAKMPLHKYNLPYSLEV